MKYHERLSRTVVKTISYRLLIIASTSITVFIFTGNLAVTAGVTLVSSLSSSFLYFLHERFWNKIQWGRTKR